MKRFICGFLAGATLFATAGVLAVQYAANPVDFKVLVNGKEFTSDPPALEVNGRTYLPLRAMGEALGIPVSWNEELRQVEVGEMLADAKISTDTQTNDKWKMKYLNYKTMTEIDKYTKAEDGKEFLIVSFEIENTSLETQNFSMFFLDSYIDDVKTPQTIIGYRIDDGVQLSAVQVEPGKKAKGYMAFQVSPDWKKADIVYNEDLMKSDNENAMKFSLSR